MCQINYKFNYRYKISFSLVFVVYCVVYSLDFMNLPLLSLKVPEIKETTYFNTNTI